VARRKAAPSALAKSVADLAVLAELFESGCRVAESAPRGSARRAALVRARLIALRSGAAAVAAAVREAELAAAAASGREFVVAGDGRPVFVSIPGRD
jgi:hypothetical protein